MRKEKNGITLIALIITIIVMLILAGISLSLVLGDNGVLVQSTEAAVKTDVAEAKEEIEYTLVGKYDNSGKYTVQDVLDSAKEVTGNDVDEETATVLSEKNNEIDISYLIDSASSYSSTITGSNQTLTGGTASYKNPTIPVGFKAVTDGASWSKVSDDEISGWNEGLVIEDESGNQFVWVPVDGDDVSYEKWCTTNLAWDDENIKDDVLPSTVSDENTQITNYGGFWGGRYEAGIDYISIVNASTCNNTNLTLYIQKGKQPWTYIHYSKAKIVAENYISNEYVQSGLITGTQWDTIMKWVQNTGYNVDSDSTGWGTHSSTLISITGLYCISEGDGSHEWFDCTGSYYEHTEESAFYIGTGLNTLAVSNNIYDLSGNIAEMTSETYYSNDRFIRRSGSGYSSSEAKPAATRRAFISAYTYSDTGFRVVLYLY